MFRKIGNADYREYFQCRDNDQDQEYDVILHGKFKEKAEHIFYDPRYNKTEREEYFKCIIQFGCSGQVKHYE